MKPLNKFLNSAKNLAGIKDQLAKQKAILEQLQSVLPSPMAEHCVGAIPKNGHLILLVDSPAWASRLRYLSPKLSKQLRQKGLAVRYIQVKVSLINSRNMHRVRRRQINPLSPANAKLLSSVAACLDDDELRMALLRLSKHGLG